MERMSDIEPAQTPQKRTPTWQAVLLASLLVVMLAMAILGLPMKTNRSGSKLKADMRAIATALETYFIDHEEYPPMRSLKDFSRDDKRLENIGGTGLFSIEPGDGGRHVGLTTPISYLNWLPEDFFASEPQEPNRWARLLGKRPRDILPFAYYTDGKKEWILFSAGPDGKYDLDPEKDYDFSQRRPTEAIERKSYDPTNGTTSRGDVYRITG